MHAKEESAVSQEHSTAANRIKDEDYERGDTGIIIIRLLQP
jgi:hypothetical protein